MIASKLHSAARLLRSPGGPWEVGRAVRRNWHQWQIRRHHGRPFVWQAPSLGEFVCIPGSTTSEHLFISRERYEEAELIWCRQWLREGDVFLDVGANIGQFSAALAPFVGEHGRIIAVEPSPPTFNHLMTTIRTLGLKNVFAECACVNDSSGRVNFMQARADTSDVMASMRVNGESGDFEEIEVSAVTIDDLLQKHTADGCCALVKIDIEGAEPLVLKAAGSLLRGRSMPMFVVEVHKAALANYGLTPADVFAAFPQDQFELFHVHRSTSDLTPRFLYGVIYPLSDPETHKWPWYSNLLAVPKFGVFSERRRQIIPARCTGA